MKAIVIARVSDISQEDGLSLDAQKRRLNTYLKDKELELLHEPYEIVESSTRGDRTKFMKIINDALKECKGEPLAIVTDRVDRFQRGFKEQVIFFELIKSGKLILHFLSENLIIDSQSKSSVYLQWNMYIMGAQMYVLNISDNVKRVIEENLAQGRPIGKLPVGYKNIRELEGIKDKGGKGVIDTDKAPLVNELFVLYSTGTYSIRKLAKIMREKGLTAKGKHGIERPISKTQIETTLSNPIYYGIYTVKGHDYPHAFGNIISKELFDKCQYIKEGKTRYAERYGQNEYIFKGLLKCKRCGNGYSTYTRKGLNYAKCNLPKEECGNSNVSEVILLKQLKSVFEGLIIPKDYMDEIVEDIKKISSEKTKFEKGQMNVIDRRLNDLTLRLDTLLNMRLDQSITQDVYNNKVQEFKDEKEDLLARKNQYYNASVDYGKVVTDLVSITSRAWNIFESSSIDRKRQLLGMIASNIEVDGKKLSVELNNPFKMIYDLNESQEWGS